MSDTFDVDDFICGGLPEESGEGESNYQAYQPEEKPEDFDWLEDCKTLLRRGDSPKYLAQSSIKLNFLSVEHITKQHNEEQGAILLKLTDLTTGEVKDVWIPKRLCGNIHTTARTIWVWNVFAEEHLEAYYETPKP